MARSRFPLRLLLLTGSALALTGCVESKLHESQDYGRSLAFDLKQQIPPTPQYAGVPAPGSDGERTALAQERYARDRIVPPSVLGASKVGAEPTTPPPAYTLPDR